MSVEMIGKQISSMRKERGIKQEELANYVGISTQAVSKWENGGVPDIELLPKIADFFGVSIDSLFGRCITDYSDLESALTKKIAQTPAEKRFRLVFNYCWDIERALSGDISTDGGIEEYENNTSPNQQIHSSIMTNDGFTLMGIANLRQYFLIVPEPKNIESAYFDGTDYISFLKDFSDKDVFNTCIMLYKRDNEAAFTSKLLVKNMKIESEKANYVITVLEKYGLLYQNQIEMDDEIKTVYYFNPTPTFIAFLIFAKEVIKKPGTYGYYVENRNIPYLK